MASDPPDCPRCHELRGKIVKMRQVQTHSIPGAYECPSCDYVIPLRPM